MDLRLHVGESTLPLGPSEKKSSVSSGLSSEVGILEALEGGWS